MAETRTIVNVLFAHPTDAYKYLPEIEAAFLAANKFVKQQALQFDVYYWENDAYRCRGEAQEIINRDLVEDADIVLAVFESKLGTPGRRYESGTDEEIHIAINHGIQDDIWVCFSENGYAVADDKEKERLKAYKTSLGNEKIFYKDFCGEKALREFLDTQIAQYPENHTKAKRASSPNLPPAHAGKSDDSISAVAEILKGETRNIEFGEYKWRVLDKQDDKALLLTEDIIERRAYHANGGSVIWGSCTLREYLNGEFFGKFSSPEQARILRIPNTNPNNQWYGTNGGKTRVDKVFLLSIDEVVKYFGDSGDLENRKGWYWNNGEHELKDGRGYCINDKYNDERAAKYYNKRAWWWLRSPGILCNYAASVDTGGELDMNGSVDYEYGGVRPALWLNLESKIS
ncbi:MAG: DUF6273 domain-containing protein [Clostridiales Family XIII bacterium]|nr:DUF6273 domain-containing protein [Clostridiales Family XIII bacterium]